jgi:hypothetical protein
LQFESFPGGVAMTRQRAWILLMALFAASDVASQTASNPRRGATVSVRPGVLAAGIEELAGATVRVPYARVVGVFNPRVLVVDTATRVPPVLGHRGRVLVLIEERTLSVPPTLIVGSTVTVVGVARTLTGMQVTREVPWPSEVSPEVLKRLEIRAAVLAGSVQTAEGVELTSAVAAQP